MNWQSLGSDPSVARVAVIRKEREFNGAAPVTESLFAQGNTALSYFFVGIDGDKKKIFTRLISILDSRIIDATRIQFYWAGRDSHGATQLTGDLAWVFKDNNETVVVPKGETFLKQLIGVLET